MTPPPTPPVSTEQIDFSGSGEESGGETGPGRTWELVKTFRTKAVGVGQAPCVGWTATSVSVTLVGDAPRVGDKDPIPKTVS